MNKLVCGILAVALYFVVAESLTCNNCKVGILGKCLISTTTTCSAAQPNCYTGKAAFPNITDFLGFYTKGCLDTASCNQTMNGSILGASYTVTRSCCSTDNCTPANSAGTVHLSLTTGAILLASVWNSLRC
ncbi:protein Bouncer-like [Megalops cyprinoides]|uniref:protein Bouncer-like n=1 Tax=Megalops cyprinoides TaxID=118141 RepID=UPI0018654D93|nr:protein Bouncer-like [Megalops cyprinoides]